MADKKIVSIISDKKEIFGTIDGNIPKTQWIPAFAGMTMHVGGISH